MIDLQTLPKMLDFCGVYKTKESAIAAKNAVYKKVMTGVLIAAGEPSEVVIDLKTDPVEPDSCCSSFCAGKSPSQLKRFFFHVEKVENKM